MTQAAAPQQLSDDYPDWGAFCKAMGVVTARRKFHATSAPVIEPLPSCTCPQCHGAGYLDDAIECPNCYGHGEVFQLDEVIE